MSDLDGQPRICPACGNELPGTRLVCPECSTLYRADPASIPADAMPVGAAAPDATGHHPPAFTAGLVDASPAVVGDREVGPNRSRSRTTGAMRALPIVAVSLLVIVIAAVAAFVVTDRDLDAPATSDPTTSIVEADAARDRRVADPATAIAWRMADAPTVSAQMAATNLGGELRTSTWTLEHDGWTEFVAIVGPITDEDIPEAASAALPEGTRASVEGPDQGGPEGRRVAGKTEDGEPVEALARRIGRRVVVVGSIGDTRAEASEDVVADLMATVTPR